MFRLNVKYQATNALHAVFIPQFIGHQCTFGLYAHRPGSWSEIALPNSYVVYGDYVEITDAEFERWEDGNQPVVLRDILGVEVTAQSKKYG